MIPVEQTADNCMAACWASILEVPLESVPDYQAIRRAGASWLNAVNVWMSKHHGRIYIEPERHLTPHIVPVGWHLMNLGVPEEGDGGHSVVGHHGRALWDPRGKIIRHPIQPDSYGLLVELTDTLRTTWERLWGTCLCPACIRGAG